MPPHRSGAAGRVACVLFCVLIGLPAVTAAAPLLVSFDATLEDGVDVFSSPGLNVVAGPEIVACPLCAGEVGEFFFDDEFVDASTNSTNTLIQYQIYGGGDPHAVDNSYWTSGWATGAFLRFDNFNLTAPGTLSSVSVSLTDVIGAGGGALVAGTDYAFTDSSLTLYLSDLGILDDTTPLGRINFTLTFRENSTPVPEPSALVLLASGAIAVAWRARRRRS